MILDIIIYVEVFMCMNKVNELVDMEKYQHVFVIDI